MAYKQQYKGLSKKGKGFTISLSEEDIKSKKSASPEKAKEISYEGQGGKDYENRPEDAINPEGQGGKDYSDYEDSVSRKASALNIEGSRADHEKHTGRKIDDYDWGGHTQREKHHRKQEGVSRKASALNKNKLNRKERKMVRQHMKGGDVKPRNPFTEVDPKKVLTEINTRKENKS